MLSYSTFSYDDDAHGPPSFAAASPEKKAKLTSSSACSTAFTFNARTLPAKAFTYHVLVIP